MSYFLIDLDYLQITLSVYDQMSDQVITLIRTYLISDRCDQICLLRDCLRDPSKNKLDYDACF